MRTFDIYRCKMTIGWLTVYAVAFILAVITGILLCKTTYCSAYMQNYASEYVYRVFNFRNFSLLFPKFIYEAAYMYAFFMIAYCTGLKFLCVPIFYFKYMLASVYCVIIVSVSALGGALVAALVFVPSALVSAVSEVFLSECCRYFDRRAAFFMPLAFACLATAAEFVLLNVLFRFIVAVV